MFSPCSKEMSGINLISPFARDSTIVESRAIPRRVVAPFAAKHSSARSFNIREDDLFGDVQVASFSFSEPAATDSWPMSPKPLVKAREKQKALLEVQETYRQMSIQHQVTMVPIERLSGHSFTRPK